MYIWKADAGTSAGAGDAVRTRSVLASDSRDMGTGTEEIEDRAKEADIERAEVDHAEGSHEVKEIEKESGGGQRGG